MKKLTAGIVLILSAFAMVGWGSTSGEKGRSESKKGYEQADTTHQGNDEDVKRSQDDESGRMDIHENKSHQDEEKDSQEDKV